MNDLENVFGFEICNSVWFQQDGASSHTAADTIRYVTSLFGNRTIGKNLAINWPPRSPDLSTLDFFLWGYVKELTFQEPPKTIPELKLKITESFEVVRHNTAMLRRVQGALVRRSELVVNQQGKHFEHKVSKKTIFCS